MFLDQFSVLQVITNSFNLYYLVSCCYSDDTNFYKAVAINFVIYFSMNILSYGDNIFFLNFLDLQAVSRLYTIINLL